VLVETKVPPDMVGKRLGDLGGTDPIGVTVVCVQPHGSGFAPAHPDTVLGAEDLLIAAGSRASVDHFVRRF
jgi:trk system potassium uptake protein TrkA